ncbi:MAG: Asparagine synthetase [glutamine-hydrolyzing] 1 [Planctomycetes bacterium]|nr:Asparagine synthetase [glutamine-hydrolyzing] 1 [Planctomycetota bacterium]
MPGGAVGFARLPIVRVDAPSAPYEAHGVVAAVNGEIWNHAEVARDLAARGFTVPPGADTAVVAPLLAADGPAGLAKLRGMFAVAACDTSTGAVTLARDRFGIKPLFVSREGRAIRFASDPSALPRRGIDRDGFLDYLAFGCAAAPRAVAAGVECVPPGTAWTFAGGARDELRFAAERPAPDCDLAAALDRAVLRHAAADVPVGILLSGGLDSSLVAALATRALGPQRCFSASFPGEGRYDESGHAAAVARHLGARHVVVPVGPPDLGRFLDDGVRAFGEPFADASAVATFAVCRRAADDVRVVLSGTGADELFGGYARYRAVPLLAMRVAGIAGRLLPQSRRTALGWAGAVARKAGCAADSDPARRYAETLAVVPRAWRRRLAGTDDAPSIAGIRGAFRGGAHGDRARAADLALYLPSDVLAKEDRCAAAFSMENRVPFLDDDVAALALAAPVARHRGKSQLRDVARGLLPRSIVSRRKRGFGVPVSEWLRGPCADLVDRHLSPHGANVRSVADPDALDGLVAAFRRGDSSLGPAVWAMIVLEASLR